jgi:hypothetical protein
MSEVAIQPAGARRSPSRIRFDRNELSGAFGDIGTDFPLIVGMIAAAKMDPASTLVMFGAMRIVQKGTSSSVMPMDPPN